MRILGIETSCDETAAAVLEGKDTTLTLKSNVLATSLDLHAKTGGIIPEQAAREQIKFILPVINAALEQAKVTISDIDALAVTYGPGLIGSLLVGVETVKTLSFVLQKPIIPVNHMIGHVYANWIKSPQPPLPKGGESALPSFSKGGVPQDGGFKLPTFPLLALIVSGGHTDLLLVKDHGDYQLLGGTRDDAAGEAFDKIGRLLGYEYPAGPAIEKLAKKGDPKRFRFPRPLVGSDDYDFSFSGLKTAVLREVQKQNNLDEQTIADICRGAQDAIIDVIIKKALKAVRQTNATSLLLSGGVAANQTMREAFVQKINKEDVPITFFSPPKNLCTDNGAMIAAAAFYNYEPISWKELTADPELYFV